MQQQVDFLSSAALHGSLKALIKLSQLHYAQTVGEDGRLQAYAFNQMIMELTDDTELYNRYNWFQQRAQSVFTPEEIEQAIRDYQAGTLTNNQQAKTIAIHKSL